MSADLNVQFIEDSVGVSIVESAPVQVTFNSVVNGTVINADYIKRINLLFAFDVALDTAHTKFTRTLGVLTNIDIWVDNTKTIKLFSKVFTYTGELLTQWTLTDEINGLVMTKTFTYVGEDLDETDVVIA